MTLLAFILAAVLPFLAPVAFRNTRTLSVYAVLVAALLSFLFYGSLGIINGISGLTMDLLVLVAASHLLGVLARYLVFVYRETHHKPAVEWIITLGLALVTPLALIV